MVFEQLLKAADGQSAHALEANRLSSYVPRQYTMAQIARELVPDDGTKPAVPIANLVAILACLESRDRLSCQPGEDDIWAERLSRRIGQSILPIHAPARADEDPDEASTAALIANCRPAAEAGLQAIRNLASTWPTAASPDVLLAAVAFTGTGDAWTTQAAASHASQLLRHHLDGRTATDEFIVDRVLKRYLRPLFESSRPSSITASGRRAAYASNQPGGAEHQGHLFESPASKPWKYHHLHAITVFSWALEQADEPLIRQNWPLFTPVLLSLLDDRDTVTRCRGLSLLSLFLDKLPPQLLASIGLWQVFEEAVFPTLSFLPNLTPEHESRRLLEGAYHALLILARRLKSAGQPKTVTAELDKMLREGIFAGLFHARDHVRIVEVLAGQAGLIVAEMGLNAVKHLKDLIDMFASVLSDPFGTSHPGTLLAGARSLQTIISSCWPRMHEPIHYNKVLNGLVLCWLNLGQADSLAIRSELVTTASMLATVRRHGGLDFDADTAPLIEKDVRLRGLFRPDQTSARRGEGKGEKEALGA